MRICFGVGGAFFLLCGTSENAFATIGEEYGYGPRAAALGGNATTWNFDGLSAYNNPAGLPLINRSGEGFPKERFSFTYGIIFMDPNFKPIASVATQNVANGGIPAPSGGSPAPPFFNSSVVDTSYKDTFGQVFGGSYRIDPEFYNLTVGFTAFFPISQLAYLDSGETFEPEYVLYRDRTQQPDLAVAAGMELLPWLRVGAGLHITYTMTSQADMFLTSASTLGSSARFNATLTPKATPYFGVNLTDPDVDKYSASLVFRLPNATTSSFQVNSSAQPIASFPNLPFAFTASSTVIYEPMTLELGGSIKTSPALRSYAQLDYQFWSKFSPPVLLVANPNTANCSGSSACGISLSPGPIINYAYRNTLTPRIGQEVSVSKSVVLRFGYAYQPGIMSGPPDGTGNYLDPDKHLFNFGMGFVFQRFLGYRKPWNLDFSTTYQAMVTQHIVKTPGDELGNSAPNFEKIGYPGYDAGGAIWGGQIALTLGL